MRRRDGEQRECERQLRKFTSAGGRRPTSTGRLSGLRTNDGMEAGRAKLASTSIGARCGPRWTPRTRLHIVLTATAVPASPGRFARARVAPWCPPLYSRADAAELGRRREALVSVAV